MIKYMSPIHLTKKFAITLFCIIILLMVPNVCLGETYKQSYDLLDNPDGSINYRLTVSINQTLIEYYNNQKN